MKFAVKQSEPKLAELVVIRRFGPTDTAPKGLVQNGGHYNLTGGHMERGRLVATYVRFY